MNERTKLSGGPDKTVTWIWLDAEGGQLKIEYYDFSEEAQRMFGNDIAYTITVNEMNKVFTVSKRSEATLIEWITENFKSYFGIKKWLEENEIRFDTEIESWA